MTRDHAERVAAEYNGRRPHPDPRHRLVVVESPRTLLDQPTPLGGHYLRREKIKD